MSVEDAVESRPLAWARLATAIAELALVIAFFYPAARAALDRRSSTTDRRDTPPAADPPMTLLVAATPHGATVLVDGQVVGQSPVATHVSCRGRPVVHLEITAPGFAPHRAELPCAAGGDLDVAPTLAPRRF
ncbi:MAG: PEGA domain-containing protein [Kofleriaceae bacterium]|nr:PEGA domain-containing protein [Kofleriaceae bacterium]MBP9858448.1 PEGA domain-containing protein [Kofleriaceae bacterium]